MRKRFTPITCSIFLSFLLLIAVLPQALAQQIVHIANTRLAGTQEGFSGNLNLSANFVQNINNIFQSVNSAQLQYKKAKSSFLSVSSLNYTLFNESRIINDGFQHLRFNYQLNEMISGEAFLQGQYNEIIKIESRYLSGMGLRFKVLEKDSMRLFVGSHYMKEWEQETTGLFNRHHRSSNYISIGLPLMKNVFLDFIGYYQPDLLNSADFRTSAQAIVEMRINKRLAFRFSHLLNYDARPPKEIRNTFYNFSNGLSYRF